MGEQSLAQARWEDQSEVSRKFRFNFENFWLGRAEDHAPIGYNDDRHICLVSGSRGGKGTSIIVNNLCFWPGSAVVIDPKGENATVTAARRGRGNSQCEGMGQTVLVLDPFEVAQVQGRYRSSFNPLDALDPQNERCIDDAARVANALIVVREDSKDPFFDESARALVKALILHVLLRAGWRDLYQRHRAESATAQESQGAFFGRLREWFSGGRRQNSPALPFQKASLAHAVSTDSGQRQEQQIERVRFAARHRPDLRKIGGDMRPQYEALLRQLMIGYGVTLPQNPPAAGGQSPSPLTVVQSRISQLAEKFKSGGRAPEQKTATPAPKPPRDRFKFYLPQAQHGV